MQGRSGSSCSSSSVAPCICPERPTPRTAASARRAPRAARRSPARWPRSSRAGSARTSPVAAATTSSGAAARADDGLIVVDQRGLDAGRAEVDAEVHEPTAARQRECVQRAAAADQDVLPAVELVRDRRVADAADAGMPQRLAVARSQRQRAVGRVAGERETRGRRQHARVARAAVQIVAPADFARRVVERAQLAAAMHGVVRAGPTVLAVLGLEEIEAVRIGRAHDEEPRRRVEARRSIVRGADLVGRHEAAVARRLLVGVRDRPPGRVDAARPVRRGERFASAGSCPSCGRAPRSSRCARPAAAACGPRRRASRRRAPAPPRRPSRACRAATPGIPI